MAIQRELWVDYINGNLFKNQQFLQFMRDRSQFVLAGKVVHIPNAGAKPSVTRNRSSLPATVTQRADVDTTYSIDEFTTDPVLIPNADTVELSYNKMASVLQEHVDSLGETIGDFLVWHMLRIHADASAPVQILRTTGAAVGSHLPSATGNRKLFKKEDLKRAQTAMNKQDIPKDNRYALLSSELLSQLQDDDDLKKRDGMNGAELDLKNGVIARLYGFNILERSGTAVYDNAGTPAVKAIGAAAAATDNDVAMLFHRDYVHKAQGTIDFFEQLNHPQFYGDVYSALVRMGGRPERRDSKGVIAIVQDASA